MVEHATENRGVASSILALAILLVLRVPAWWLLLLLFLGLVLALNHLGVRIAIGAMLTLAAISFTPMLFLALDIIVKGGNVV